MSDLKEAILDARYIDMISVADFVVRDCGLPAVDDEGNMLPQANEIAAALFRWAADVDASGPSSARPDPAAKAAWPDTSDDEYDENGDPVMDAEEAEARDAEVELTAANGSQEGDA
jgi:hypothetical protein